MDRKIVNLFSPPNQLIFSLAPLQTLPYDMQHPRCAGWLETREMLPLPDAWKAWAGSQGNVMPKSALMTKEFIYADLRNLEEGKTTFPFDFIGEHNGHRWITTGCPSAWSYQAVESGYGER